MPYMEVEKPILIGLLGEVEDDMQPKSTARSGQPDHVMPEASNREPKQLEDFSEADSSKFNHSETTNANSSQDIPAAGRLDPSLRWLRKEIAGPRCRKSEAGIANSRQDMPYTSIKKSAQIKLRGKRHEPVSIRSSESKKEPGVSSPYIRGGGSNRMRLCNSMNEPGVT